MAACILTDKQIKAIREHKYSAEGTSICEPVMQIYWRWLVEQIPRTWAPNTITLVGLIINIVTTLILVFYSSDAVQEAPRWAYLSCALGLFIYQSLDAIDGKQARRTGSNTPLGELFDHGCDAVSTVFVMMGVGVSMKLGQDPMVFLIEMCISELCYYMAHWQTYVTGTLRFGKIDVTEAQFSCIAIYVICAISPGFFNTTVPVIDIPLRHMVVIVGCIPAVFLSIKTLDIILQGGVGKNKSTVAGSSTIFPAVPVGLVMFLQIVIATKTSVYTDHKCLYLFCFGMVAAKMTNNIVVAHMAKSEISLIDAGFIGPLVLFLNQYFNSILPEYPLLLVVTICALHKSPFLLMTLKGIIMLVGPLSVKLYVVQDLVLYSVRVCRQICESLGIYCFDITSRPDSKDQGQFNGKRKK